MTEIQLFAKNKFKIVDNRASADVVVLDNVLYSNPNGELPYNQVLSSGSRRRLSDVASVIVKENKQAGLTTNVYITRVWNLKWPAGTQPTGAQHIDLKYALPGTVGLFQVSPDTVAMGIAGTMSITETDPVSTIGQVEVVSTVVATSQEIQVRYKTNATGTEYAFLSVDVNVVPLLKDNATFEKIKGASVLNHLDIAYDDRVQITASSASCIFTSNKNLQVNTTFATKFITESSGGSKWSSRTSGREMMCSSSPARLGVSPTWRAPLIAPDVYQGRFPLLPGWPSIRGTVQDHQCRPPLVSWGGRHQVFVPRTTTARATDDATHAEQEPDRSRLAAEQPANQPFG